MVLFNVISKGVKVMNIEDVRIKGQLLVCVPNVFKVLDREGQRPGAIEPSPELMAFLGTVVGVDNKKIILKIKGQDCPFDPKDVWTLPPELEEVIARSRIKAREFT